MDPEVLAYFKKIINTLAVGLLWFAINSTAGIMYNLAFVEDTIQLKNVLFYIWFIISLSLLIWYFYKMWSKPLDIRH